MRLATLAALVPLLAAPALAQSQQAVPTALSCDGPFAKDSDHARIVKTFGAANVKFMKIPGPEGSELQATVVYEKDAKRRLDITWINEKARRIPNVIVREEGSTWKTADGIGLETPLVEIEKLNGKPFKLSGFEWDMGGYVMDLQGGALAKRAGGCRLGLRFAPGPKAPESALTKVAGDRTFASTDPNMRAARPVVSEISLHWPR